MPVEAKAHEITRPQGSAAIRQPLLRDVADQPVAAAHRTTEQLDRAAGERLGAEDGAEQAGLAGAVRSEYGDEFAGTDLEVEVRPEGA